MRTWHSMYLIAGNMSFGSLWLPMTLEPKCYIMHCCCWFELIILPCTCSCYITSSVITLSTALVLILSIHYVLLQFFFKATLLQQVNELLETIRDQLNNADSVVQELEKSIKPVMRELDELREKIKNMEHIEEIAHDIDNLKKKLAWSWVYEVDQQIEEQTVRLQKLKERIPACQERIDRNTVSCVLFTGNPLYHCIL